MKENGKIDKIMHYLVHNSFLFTVVIMWLVHATLLTIMLIARVMDVAYLNVISVIVYMFCALLAKFGHMMPVYLSIFVEVTIYSVIATRSVGWDSGAYCFILSIVPIMIYFGCVLFKGARRWIIVIEVAVIFVIYVFLYVRYVNAKPVHELHGMTRTVLMVFSSFAMYFSMLFYYAMYIYASESEMGSLEKKNKQLSADAQEDVLTNLLNRRGFLPMVESSMHDKRAKHFCIAFCDLDNFKRVNDSYGHDCGDEVLRHVTKILKREMQGCEICRWGGEEFVILMRDYDLNAAEEKMESIRRLVEENPTVFYNKRINATMTIGLEEYKEGYRKPEEIIKVSDERMYYGKQHGKNIVIYESHLENGQEGTT
ncbi:MAG: GGDEF domain-containing protein [Lachnospiraceae bacterium]|nr:GGDEF domain-containing protein [Lachnospiraceae bacterium]